MKEINVQDFKEVHKELERSEDILLDVRTVEEFSFSNLGGINIPLDQLQERWSELNISKGTKVYCLCHHGVRSAYACQFLETISGESKEVYNIKGGIEAWSTEIDPSIPRY